MILKAVCFDMDGVTIDTEPLYAKAEIRLFREYGVEIPEEDWVLFRGCTEEKFYDLSMKRYGITEDKNFFMNKGRSYVKEEFLNHLDFMDGFFDLHQNIIENGITTALVTASPEEMYRFVDSRLDLESKFNVVVFGGMSKQQKPHPGPYLLALEKLGLKPTESVIIEDSLHGLEAAKASGAVVVGLRGSIPEDSLKIADHVISELSELNSEKLQKIHKTYHL